MLVRYRTGGPAPHCSRPNESVKPG